MTGKEPIAVDLDYAAPIMEHTRLGGLPRDYFDQNPQPAADFVPCDNGVCQTLPTPVWRTLPQESVPGQPRMQTLRVHLEDRPASPFWSALGWGVCGALAGAAIGGAAGLFIGSALTLAAGGAVAAGLAGGALGAVNAAGDRIRIVWDERPISTVRLTGYRETVTPGRFQGQQGYYHRFEPVLVGEHLGTYRVPRIEHYKES